MQKISKKHPCRVNTIQTDCVITPFFERKKGVLVSGCEVESTVWDTGATNTIISSAVIDALGLKPVRQNHRGQLLWDGMSPQRAQLSDIPEHATVDIGDTVITSGASAFFPEGLVVGTISAIEPDRNGGFFDIDIDLAVDYNAVYHVYLIENLAAQERNDLEKPASDE